MEYLPQEALVVLFDQTPPEDRSSVIATMMALNTHFHNIIKPIAHLEHNTWLVIHRKDAEVARFQIQHTHMGKVMKIIGNVRNSPVLDFHWIFAANNFSKGILSYWNSVFRNSLDRNFHNVSIGNSKITCVSIPYSIMRVTKDTLFEINSDALRGGD